MTNPVWLLDANLDIQLEQILTEFGVECSTAQGLGWKALSNGELVSAAVEAGFTCLLTRDRLFAESASRALKKFPQFAVVLLSLPQKKQAAFARTFRATWAIERIVPMVGQTIVWPSAAVR